MGIEEDYNIANAGNDLDYSPSDDEMFDETDSSIEFSNVAGRRKVNMKLSGVKGGRVRRKSKRGAFWKNLDGSLKKDWFAIKKGGFAPERGAYLGLLKLNAWGMATKLANLKTAAQEGNAVAQNAWNKILRHWAHFGGDVNILQKNINAGKAKKQLVVRVDKRIKLTPTTGEPKSSFVVLGTAIATSVPIWVPIVGALGAAGAVVGKLSMNPSDQDSVAQAAADPANQLSPQEADASADQVQAQVSDNSDSSDDSDSDTSSDDQGSDSGSDFSGDASKDSISIPIWPFVAIFGLWVVYKLYKNK